jgi:OOP family OmpA-OmpF porin
MALGTLLLGCGLALASTAAAAGPYAGFSIGMTSSDVSSSAFDRDLADAGFDSKTSIDDDGTGFRIFGGYQFNAYVAAELAYVDLDEITADTDIFGGNPGRIDTSMEIDGFNLGVTLGYPFADAFSVYAKAGVFIWDAEVDSRAQLALGDASSSADDDGSDFSYGIGASYRFTDNFAVRLDWDRYQMGGEVDTDIDLFAIGAQMNF